MRCPRAAGPLGRGWSWEGQLGGGQPAMAELVLLALLTGTTAVQRSPQACVIGTTVAGSEGKGGWCPAGSLSPVGTGGQRGSPGEDAASRGHHPPSQPQGGSEASKARGQRGRDSCSELPQLVGGAEDRPSAHGLALAGAWSLCSPGFVTSHPAPQSWSCGEPHFQGA